MGRSKKAPNTITTEEFDRKCEAGEDISDYLDWDNATKKVNVDFPLWMLQELSAEANRLQIPRQAIIKLWLDEKLQQVKRERLLTDRHKPIAG